MWTAHVEPDPIGISHVRSSARTYLEASGVRDQLEPTLLVLSELAANAVWHGEPQVSATVIVAENSIRVEVDDASPAPPVVRDRDPHRVGGNGMLLVESLVSRWGVRQYPGDGKSVWAELPCG